MRKRTFMPQIPFFRHNCLLGFKAIYIFLALWKQSREKEHIMLNTLSRISNGFIYVGSLVKIRIKGSYQRERRGLEKVANFGYCDRGDGYFFFSNFAAIDS